MRDSTARNVKAAVYFALVVSVVGAFALMCFTGCQSQTPAQKLALQNQTVALALNAAADLRDAGLLSQAEIDQAKPFVDAYLAAERVAERQIRAAEAAKAAGQPVDQNAVDDAVQQALAALRPLEPFLAKLDAAKAKARPAGK